MVILAPATSQPRYHRRARFLAALGFSIEVYAFQRSYYLANYFPKEMSLRNLGQVRQGNYIRRIPHILGSIPRIRRWEHRRPQPSLVYAFGLDMAFIGSLAFPRSVPLVYETGDLQNPLPHRSIRSRMLGAVDRWLTKRAVMLGVTSSRFTSEYYEFLDPGVRNRTILFENRMAPATAAKFPRASSLDPRTGPLRIGFIGRLRYPGCLLPLIEGVVSRPDGFILEIHGDGPLRPECEEASGLHSNVHYHGPFRNPDDLGSIYAGVDLSYVVYDNSDTNVQLALPNKLYEGPWFGTPLVVAEDTYLADRVRDLGIGWVIDPRRPGFVNEFLDGLNRTEVIRLAGQALSLSSELLVEENDEAGHRILELLGRFPRG